MADTKLKTESNLLPFAGAEDIDELCPPWWPQLIWRLHFPIGGGGVPHPSPVNYPPAIDNLMANLHIHTMSYLMKDQHAAQEIRNVAEEQMGNAVRNLSKDHNQAKGKAA